MGGEGANRDVATESVAAVAHSNKDTSPSFGSIAKAVHAVISLQSQARKLQAEGDDGGFQRTSSGTPMREAMQAIAIYGLSGIAPRPGHRVFLLPAEMPSNHSPVDVERSCKHGKVVKVVERIAAVSQTSRTLSCGVQWEGGDNTVRFHRTGLGGVFELGLSMDDLDHPTFEFRQARAAKTAKAKQRNKQQPLSTLKEVVAQSIEQRPENVSKASEHQEASEKPAAAGDRTVEPEDEMEQKDSTSSDRTLQRRSTFALKDSDREPTKIEEFPITKSRKELEIEQAQRARAENGSRQRTGSLLRSDSAASNASHHSQRSAGASARAGSGQSQRSQPDAP